MSTAPLVDVHAHFVTPWYVEAARAAGHEMPDGMPGWPDWTPEVHLRLMDEHGIDQSVLSISSPGVHFGDDQAAIGLARRVNDFAAEVRAQYPDRFRFFASTPLPVVDAALEEIARCLDNLGAAGIAVETNTHGRYLSETAFEPIFAELDRREAVLFLHPTSPPGGPETALGLPRPMLEFLVETTRTIAALAMSGRLTTYPSVRLIVPHCGAFLPLEADRLDLFSRAFGAGPSGNSVGESLGGLWYDLAGTPMPTHAETLITKMGSHHLLYGSDYCWTPPAAVAGQVASLDSSWDAATHGPWRELVSANAATLFSGSRDKERRDDS